MKVATNIPVLVNPHKILTKIAAFWDTVSPGWQKIWGPHIHHGFYELSDKKAKTTDPLPEEMLLAKLCALLELKPNQTLLDVGCGMGGSAFYIAKHYKSRVLGITLSQQQINIVKKEQEENKIKNVSFKIEDAHTLTSIANESFDIVWSLESAEQFYDKNKFMDEAFRILKPGGKIMIATWCSELEQFEGQYAKDYLSLCRAFHLPYMPTIQYYKDNLAKKYSIITVEDWTSEVKQSWDKGILQLKQFSFWQVFRLGGVTGLKFIQKLNLMSKAFKSGQLRYAVFIAKKIS